jgi:GntR family transcriptional regulator/MocR family aminotransferase
MDVYLELDRRESSPLYRQVYKQLRTQILSGALPAGTRLPSSRKLAGIYNLARVTVATAYEQLRDEGYLVSRAGAGTIVALDLDLPYSPRITTPKIGSFLPDFSSWGQRIVAAQDLRNKRSVSTRPAIDFGFGRSFPHIFPYDIWRRLLARYLSTDDTMLSRYGSVAGFYSLREAVADYLVRLRGVNCTTEQVVIVSGIQQALDILSRLMLQDGDQVLVETPGYTDAFRLFKTFGAGITALPVDDDGFPVEQIPRESKARFVFVTPSNQFPKGGALPLGRRLALLQWAQKTDALILEDDYDGELRYDGHPLSALQGLDKDDRVVYLGTFSKVLFPALRLGYIVLPNSLLSPFLLAKELVDRAAPTLTQAAVADFIIEGHFERHLRKLRKEYGGRRRTLIESIETFLSGQVQYNDNEAGLHVMLYLDQDLDESLVVRRAADAGVGVYPGASYHLDGKIRPSILLGFTGLSRNEIKRGIKDLASIIRDIKNSKYSVN